MKQNNKQKFILKEEANLNVTFSYFIKLLKGGLKK